MTLTMRAVNLLKKHIANYRQNINPPYKLKDTVTVVMTLFILLATPLTLIAVLTSQQLQVPASIGIDIDKDGFSDAVETFIGTNPNSNCSVTANSSTPNNSWPPDVSGDDQVNSTDAALFTSKLNSRAGSTRYDKRFDLNADLRINKIDLSKLNPYMGTSCQTSTSGSLSVHNSLFEPLRAAFYYGWYPEQWTSAGHHWTSTLGTYDSADKSVIDQHIDWLKYAKINAGIYSWWGIGQPTDLRLPLYLERAQVKDFKWGIYYELDWNTSRTLDQIRSDMNYLRDHYFTQTGYLYVNNKPVVFVYMPNVPSDADGCVQVAKWTTIRNEYNLYVNLTDVPQWWACNTLDSWHGYKPSDYLKAVYFDDKINDANDVIYSLSISAGFWSAQESTPRLARDFSQWQAIVNLGIANKPRWLLFYFNEFGEGTNIEPSGAQCTETGCLDYLKFLNQDQ